MEMMDKQCRIQNAAVSLFQEQGVDSTSVNDIVKKANVAKGTFYVYYKDKNALISQVLTKQHGTLVNEIINTAYDKANHDDELWKKLFVEELIQHHRQHPLLLKTIQKNMPFIFDTEEHRITVYREITRLPQFLALWKRDNESERSTLNRFMLVMEIVGVVCYNALSFDHPDMLDNLLEEVRKATYRIMDCEVNSYEL